MPVSGLIAGFAEAFSPPEGADAVSIPSLVGCADAFLAYALSGGPRAVLAVTPGIPDADRLAADLHTLCDAAAGGTASGKAGGGASRPGRASTPDGIPRILEFPSLQDDDPSAFGIRAKTIAALHAWQLSPYPAVIVAAFPSLAQPMPRNAPRPIALDVDSPAAVPFSQLCADLTRFGYSRTTIAVREGDYSVRGGIVDVWSPGDESPVRAEFFGEELESLRLFDPATQTSLFPVRTALLAPCADASGEAVPEGGPGGPDAADGESPPSIFDILPDGSAVLALEHNGYSLRIPRSRRLRIVYTGDPPPPGVPSYAFRTAMLPGFSELGADDSHHPELFEAARKRLDRHLQNITGRGGRILRLDDLSGGFETGGFAVVAKSDRVFAKRRSAPRRGSAAAAQLGSFDELEPGELVVHVDHGVGRFIGSSEIKVDGRRSEVFTIEYEGGARLHVPASHAHLVSRYIGVKGEEAKLHRLDGTRWEKDKNNARNAIADLAASLLDTQARRAMAPGFAYDTECDGMEAFEAAFPYEETQDQAAAIQAVKEDMASSRPMDRLVCGDAGYGKTEVAMRAAYIAAMNGRQVAVLAPTTVLAEQHFETFLSRFDGTPVNIEAFSRFQSPALRQATADRIASGTCDIAIGTHALLSKRISFKDLGLVIIDEEQRFGVAHKEYFKRMRATADILTLSATPIPRTLYLSMTGMRDLSLLRTPPRERVAVETRIERDSDDTVRGAIEAELAHGGQVFFLHNRVATIERVERRLKALCPKARITTAHGRMDAQQLARKVREFERGKTDILLSTTIVESGIDIPRANTILVDRADTFGLADLYQLRGRVGRASRQGRAILLLPPSGGVDSDARERLKALQRHGGLGAGFNLALRDLELRGAGNLLGAKQSGHIAAIGFTLYCQLLKRTMARLKGEKVADVVDVRLSLDFLDLSPASPDAADAASLPYTYIEDDVLRMSLLRRFAEAMSAKEVAALEAEMRDRFGPPPAAARRFARLASLRARCAEANIGRIDAMHSRAVLYRADTNEIAGVETLPDGDADTRLAALAKAVGKLSA